MADHVGAIVIDPKFLAHEIDYLQRFLHQLAQVRGSLSFAILPEPRHVVPAVPPFGSPPSGWAPPDWARPRSARRRWVLHSWAQRRAVPGAPARRTTHAGCSPLATAGCSRRLPRDRSRWAASSWYASRRDRAASRSSAPSGPSSPSMTRTTRRGCPRWSRRNDAFGSGRAHRLAADHVRALVPGPPELLARPAPPVAARRVGRLLRTRWGLLCSRDEGIRNCKLRASGECTDAQQHRNRGPPSHIHSFSTKRTSS